MNIATMLARSARYRPNDTALVYDRRTRTFREFGERVMRMAAALTARGGVPGDRVLIVQRNRPELLEGMLAAMHAGMVAVPVNWHLHPKEIAFMVKDCDASAVMFGEESSGVAAELSQQGLAPLTVSVGEAVEGAVGIEDLIAEGGSLPVAEVDPASPAWLFYTSGTTGQPKGAMLSHRNLLAMTMGFYADISPVDDASVFLHAAPLTHGSGLYFLPALGKSAASVISASPNFDPVEYLHLISEHRVTHAAFLAPTMLTRLLECDEISSADLTSLDVLVFGGGPMYVPDLKRACDVFGPRLVQIYGQGEAPMTITATIADDLRRKDPLGTRRLASCGIARTDVELRIVSPDDAEVSDGETGEICVRGDVVMGGYWQQPEATAEALRDGWLHTGDLGYQDEDGYLFLNGRAKDLIITGGSNVYPREVEEVLLKHDAVLEVAVIGIPDREWGESVKAVVSLRPGQTVTEAELIDHCRAELASFKKPKVIEFRDDLPKNAAGKIVKRELS